MLPLQPPAQTQPPPPAPLPLEEALARLQDDYDQRGEGATLEAPPVHAKDRPAVRWLQAALTQDHPANPFRKGTRSHVEAEAVRALLGGGSAALPRLTLREAGSQFALWRWGRRLERAGRLPAALRRGWEDLLRKARPASLATSYALRHALCFALAEADDARFAELKAAHGEDMADLLLGFQRLFGLLGSPGPKFRLWEGASVSAVERRLGELNGARVWIAPPEGPSDGHPEGVAWIVPLGTTAGGRPPEEELRSEAARTLRALREGTGIWFAPEREDFEACGLSFFPVLVTLGDDGRIAAIRMGEAAPPKP